jgi:hypothetical protein
VKGSRQQLNCLTAAVVTMSERPGHSAEPRVAVDVHDAMKTHVRGVVVRSPFGAVRIAVVGPHQSSGSGVIWPPGGPAQISEAVCCIGAPVDVMWPRHDVVAVIDDLPSNSGGRSGRGSLTDASRCHGWCSCATGKRREQEHPRQQQSRTQRETAHSEVHGDPLVTMPSH